MSDYAAETLLRIITTGESDRVEFKESLAGDNPTRVREAICAFANDLPGHNQPGYIFIGVKDDRTIGTLAITDELLRQLADMKTDGNIVPPPSHDRGETHAAGQGCRGGRRAAIQLAAGSL